MGGFLAPRFKYSDGPGRGHRGATPHAPSSRPRNRCAPGPDGRQQHAHLTRPRPAPTPAGPLQQYFGSCGVPRHERAQRRDPPTPPGTWRPALASARPAPVRTASGSRRLSWSARSAGSSMRCWTPDAARSRPFRRVREADDNALVALRSPRSAVPFTFLRVPRALLGWRIGAKKALVQEIYFMGWTSSSIPWCSPEPSASSSGSPPGRCCAPSRAKPRTSTAKRTPRGRSGGHAGGPGGPVSGSADDCTSGHAGHQGARDDQGRRRRIPGLMMETGTAAASRA